MDHHIIPQVYLRQFVDFNKKIGSGLIALIGKEKLINKQADCGIVDRY